MIAIEVATLITVVSATAAIYFNLRNLRRQEKDEVRHDTIEVITMAVTLRSIEKSIDDIRETLHHITVIREKLILLEAQINAAHKRMDRLERHHGKKRGGH